MGSLIIQEVVRDLVRYHGLRKAKKFFLAGSRYSHCSRFVIPECLTQSFAQRYIVDNEFLCVCLSAGGTGVLLNVDHVASLLAELAPTLDVRGIADSGWFLDNKQYSPIACSNAQTCAPIEAVQKGLEWVCSTRDAFLELMNQGGCHDMESFSLLDSGMVWCPTLVEKTQQPKTCGSATLVIASTQLSKVWQGWELTDESRMNCKELICCMWWYAQCNMCTLNIFQHPSL